MQFPFDDRGLESQLKSLQIALLRSGGQRRVMPSPEEKSVQNFGRALFDALLVRDVHTLYAVSRREALGQGKGLRVKLRIEPPELAMLPWEFLYDSDQVEYVCLSRITPVVRYLELPQPIQPLGVVPPLRILGMVACPSDLPKLDVTREKGWVEEAIRDLHANGLVKLTWLEGHTWRDLQQALRRGPWHIFHFVGHGGFDRNADEGFIALADESGKTHRLKATLLGRLLADHGSLRLVLLNACEGARGSEQDIFSSTAAILVQRGIPAVLAMQYEITDQAALEFARSFYGALADSLPVDAAVAEARRAVSFAVNNTVEWGTPALYMRSPDGVLFHIQGRTKTDEVREGARLQASHEAKEIGAQDAKEVPEQEATVEAPSATQSTEEVLAQEVTIEAPSIPQDIPSERVEELYNQGMEHFNSQSWEKAVETFDQLVQIAPWYKGAGQILIEVKDRVREAEDLERKTARKSEYMEDLYRMGSICFERGQWGAAADYLRRIDEAGEKYKDAAGLLYKANRQLRLQALYAESAARLRERKWTEAKEILDEIVGLDPTDERARAKLRQAKEQHRLQTLYEEALEHLHEERWSQAIGVLEKISGYRDATDRLKEAQKNRDLTNLYYAGVGCLEDGRWQDAIDKFREIIRRVETYKDVADKLAQAERRQRLERLFRKGKDYLRQQRWKEAMQEFEKASVVDPDRQDILAGLEEARWQLRPEELRERGEASLNAENWQGAVEILGELRGLDPTDTSVATKLEKVKRQLELRGLYDRWHGWREILNIGMHLRNTVRRLARARDRRRFRRFTDVRFPEKCRIHQPVQLRVQLTLGAPKKGARIPPEMPRPLPPTKVAVEPTAGEIEERKIDLLVIVSAAGFDIDQRWRKLSVPFGQDSEIMQFELVGHMLGSHIVEVEFYHSTVRVGYVVVETQVVDGDTLGQDTQVTYEALNCQPQTSTIERPVVTLIATWQEEKGIDYCIIEGDARLPVGGGFAPMAAREETVVGYWQGLNKLFEETVQLSGLPEDELNSIWLNMRGWGQQLSEKLLPAELRRHSSTWPAGSIVLISTNEQWVPWELIYDGQDFWGNKFVLARIPRIPGQSAFSATDKTVGRYPSMRLRKVVHVIGGRLQPSEIVERVRELFTPFEAKVTIKSVERATLAKVFDSITNADLVHFTCHGYAAPEHCLQLGDNLSSVCCLNPINLKTLPESRGSLIFANACASAVITSFLGGLCNFGWEFYKKGAVAYIGTLGVVPTEYAVTFAERFYEQLLKEDRTVGDSLYHAKSTAERGNPFWLLYTLHGDPSARKSI